MKHKKWLTCLAGCGITLLLALGTAGSVATAFSIPAEGFLLPAALCSIAVALSLFLCGGKLHWLPVLAAVLLGLLCWRWGDLETSAELILHSISAWFDRVYDCGVIRWTDAPLKTDAPVSGLCAIATLVALAAAGCVFRELPILFASVFFLATPILCVAAIDPTPGKLWLFLLLTGYLLLLLTDMPRQRRSEHWHTLTGMLAIPVALAVLLLIHVPQKELDPKGHIQALADRIAEQFPGNTGTQGGLSVTGSPDGDRIELSLVSEQSASQVIVMDLSGSALGALYLRGQVLDRYDGRSWSSSGEHSGLPWPAGSVLQDAGQLHIHTRPIFSAIYVPYYADKVNPDATAVRLNNPGHRDYSYDLRALTDDAAAHQIPATPDTPCLQLPDSTRRWAEELLETFLPEDRREPCAIAGRIGEYVKASAEYSLQAESMPNLGTDFVRWFLETQDRGYCVHFASSAVVLLRAAGIPARYVTGYAVTKSGETAVVREKDAHAWAEYWVDGIGWMILEATPPDSQTPEQTTPQDTTVPTTAPTVAPTTDPTVRPSDPIQTIIVPSLPTQLQPLDGQPPEDSRETPLIWSILKWVLPAVLLVLLAEGQRLLRILLRRHRLQKASPNAKALLLWRECTVFARLLGEQPPRRIHATAQKAKFSRHTLTPEELAVLTEYLRNARTRLSQKPWYLRTVYRYLFAEY